MTTHDVELLLGLPKQTLHYYEREGLIEPDRDDNNYRHYSQKDIDTLRLIQLLRSMELSIDEIKLIFNNELSIRKALETKQEYIQNTKLELENIDQRIKDYIKRKKVNVIFENTEDHDLEQLACYNNMIKYGDVILSKDNIESIDISMCSSIGLVRGLIGVYMNYYVDLDIHMINDTFSFQIMNNEQVCRMFDYLKDCKCNDPLGLVSLYNEKRDMAALNKYLDNHFKEWAKEYHLDNPRDDNILTQARQYTKDHQTIEELKEVNKELWDIKNIFKKHKNNG